MTHSKSPWAFGLVRDGNIVGVEPTLALANQWVADEIVPLVPMHELDQLQADLADITSLGQRLALELECLLLDTKDLPTVSKWWDPAIDAIFDWREYIAAVDRRGQPEKQANIESCTKCTTPDLCREYGRACDYRLQLPETSVPALVFYPAGSLGEEVAP